MGMFDTVWVNCPYCNERTGIQSKSGPCTLEEYEIETAPLDVMCGLTDDCGWKICRHCELEMKVVPSVKPTFTVVKKGEYE